MDIIPNKDLPHIAKKEPAMVNVQPGKIYAWCTCGLSQKQPFCDGVHKKIAHTIDEHDEPILPYKSIKVEFEKEEEVWFCQCKQTKTPHYCDGSHNKLK
jgi:CDGSH-type Zn-finger protein